MRIAATPDHNASTPLTTSRLGSGEHAVRSPTSTPRAVCSPVRGDGSLVSHNCRDPPDDYDTPDHKKLISLPLQRMEELRMRIRMLISVTLFLMVAGLLPGLSQACDISNGDADCNGSCINVTWDVDYDGCSFKWHNIWRKCGTGGSWLLVGSQHGTPPFVDCGPFPGCGAGYYYKVTIYCTCHGEDTSDTIEIGPISCP